MWICKYKFSQKTKKIIAWSQFSIFVWIWNPRCPILPNNLTYPLVRWIIIFSSLSDIGLGITLVCLPIAWCYFDFRYVKYFIMVILLLIIAFFVVVFRWNNRNKSFIQKLLALGAVSHLLGNIIATCVFSFVSHNNYPGGVAMMNIHRLESSSTSKLFCITSVLNVMVDKFL